MKPFANFRFEVAHFQINVRFLPFTTLAFDDIYSPFVEIDLKSMFQRSLYDYIYRLQFIGTICKNKPKKDVKVFVKSEIPYSCKCSNNQSTIQV